LDVFHIAVECANVSGGQVSYSLSTSVIYHVLTIQLPSQTK